MIKLITILLLLTPTIPANATPNLCKEIEAVLWESVEEGIINKQEATQIAGNCSLETYE